VRAAEAGSPGCFVSGAVFLLGKWEQEYLFWTAACAAVRPWFSPPEERQTVSKAPPGKGGEKEGDRALMIAPLYVIPAKPGIHVLFSWVPARAGMT